jgi:peptidoglycan/xylan/chitin deacetylase (PgdA/CDA1 family)
MEPNCPEANELLMTSRQLLALPGNTIEIGSHTVSHPDLAALPPSEALQELIGSRQYLEALLGEPVKMISLPFGRYTLATMRLARQVGYDIVMTSEPQVACGANGGPKVGRFRVTPGDWAVEFRLKVAGAYGWLVYAQRLRRILATARKKSFGARKARPEGIGDGRPSDGSVLGSAVRARG